MREYPLIFSAVNVRAILLGEKFQTRRVIRARNSTVLGYTVTPKHKLWTGLVWDKRVEK